MPRQRRKDWCYWYAHCKQLKGACFSIGLSCACVLHKDAHLTIYRFDKRLTDNPIFRAYKQGQEPKNLRLGPKGYYLMGDTLPPVHLLTPSGPTYCGMSSDNPAFRGIKKTRVANKVSCPDCNNMLAATCYCVCHSPVSSCPWCEHCLGNNVVVMARTAGKTTAILQQIYTIVASEVADEFYPKGHPRRGEYLRDIGVLFARLQPKLVKLISQQKYLTKQQVRELMSTNQIIEDINNEQGQTSPLHKNEATGGQPPGTP